jgi:signal transduction histidine kinase
MKFSPRLRTILFIVNMAVMLLPLGGLTILRVYETEMIRQKEGALHSQGAYLSSMFRREISDKLGIPNNEDANGRVEIGLPLYDEIRSTNFPSSSNLSFTDELRLLESSIRDPHRNYVVSSESPEAATGAAGEALLPVILLAQNLNMDQVWVVDHNGIVVASSLGDEKRSLISWEEVQRALQGESVSLLRRVNPINKRRLPLDIILGLGEPHMVYVGIPTVLGSKITGAVIMAGAPSQITQFLYGNQGKLLNALALILLVVTIITALSSFTISEPIQALIKQTELIQRGDPKGLVRIRWPILREITQLSEALVTMAKTITDRSEYIKSFARNVSHEFKTPLAGIGGTVELLRDSWPAMNESDRNKFLGNLERDTKRLSNLVTGMLAFARAEVAQPSEQIVELNEALASAKEKYARSDIEIIYKPNDEAISTRMAPELFDTIVKNIIENVCQHCKKGTHLRIELKKVNPDMLEFNFEDNGSGISANNLEKIRTPFFTTARATGGTGLGLSIVHAIVTRHGGTLKIASELGKGTRVSIALPLVAKELK